MKPRLNKTNREETERGFVNNDELNHIMLFEVKLQELLSPFESYMMSLQSLLVWESTVNSTIFLIFVHLVFWLATQMRFFYLLGLIGMTVTFYDMWFNVFWPEIKVPPSPDEDTEGWTTVHPVFYSMPEICSILAEYVVYFNKWLNWYIDLRKKSPAKFFVVSICMFSSTATIGMYISGFMLIYLQVLSILVLPALSYHRYDKYFWKFIEPYVRRAEATLSIKRGHGKKNKNAKRKHSSCKTKACAYDDSDASDDEIEEFIPKPNDPKVKVTLSKATSDSDDSSVTLRELMVPRGLSQTPSRGHSDCDSHDEGFTEGISTLPAFDDSHIEDSYTDDNLDSKMLAEATDDLDSVKKDDTLTENDMIKDLTLGNEDKTPQLKGIQFVTTHFKESSDSSSESEDLQKGLRFTDDVEGMLPSDDVLMDEETANQEIGASTSSSSVGEIMDEFVLLDKDDFEK